MISFKDDTSPSKKKKNQAFMLQVIEYQLERINMRFDEWYERVNKRDAKLQNEQFLRVANARRQEKLRF
jgi:hypothetical protein